MRIVTLDSETFYDQDYSLSKLTTEEYVRDPRFEDILWAIKVGDNPTYWVPAPDFRKELARLDLEHNAVLCHHAHFDASILYHHYGVRPKLILDTLGMGRALHGANGRLSLEKLAERYGLPPKGHEVHNVKGMRFADFSAAALKRYGDYSVRDVDICYWLAQKMLPHFSREELQIHDYIIRMFTEPVLQLDVKTLQNYANDLAANKVKLLQGALVAKDDVMSNAKFAQLLLDRGVEPPMKQSPSWLKKQPEDRDPAKEWVYAFAKNDAGMQALQEHEDPMVQALVEARLENKTTIAEKGAQRLIGMAGRGNATVYLKYSGASGTHRLSGGDKFNWQSMKRGSPLRDAVMAEEGQVCVVGDSSNIEARIVDWLAGQDDMVEVYRRADRKEGPDVYCVMAERIYKRPVVKADHPMERQMGKVCIAEGTLILTPTGLKPVEEISVADRLWDGIEWVTHDGVICNGDKEVIYYQGIWATPDHEVYTECGRKISIGQAASEMARIITTGLAGEAVRLSRDSVFGAKKSEWIRPDTGALPQLGQNCMEAYTERTEGEGHQPAPQWANPATACGGIGASIRCNKGPMQRPEEPAVSQLRRARNSARVRDAQGIRGVHYPGIPTGYVQGAGYRSQGQRWALRTGKSSTGYAQGEPNQSAQYRLGFMERGEGVTSRMEIAVRRVANLQIRSNRGPDRRANHRDCPGSSAQEAQELASYRRTARVYDILNAGPRNRFTANGLLVANCKLGLGFGMGDEKFVAAVRGQAKDENKKPLIITREFSKLVVGIYRDAHPQVQKLWKRGGDALRAIAEGRIGVAVDYRGVVKTCKDGLVMPGGLKILYPDLKFTKSAVGWGGEWSFWNGKERERIYGAKVIENIVQCLARIIVFNQCRLTANETKGIARWVHSVHDEGVFVAPIFYAPYVQERLLGNMRIAPDWAPDLPLNSEGGFNRRYGHAKA